MLWNTLHLYLGKFGTSSSNGSSVATAAAAAAAAAVAAAAVVPAEASVRYIMFLRNGCMHPVHILWKSTYPPYL